MDVILLSISFPFLICILAGYIYMYCTGRLQDSIRFPPTVAEFYALYLIFFFICWGYILTYSILHPLPVWNIISFSLLFMTHFSFIPLYISAHKQENLTAGIKLNTVVQIIGHWMLMICIIANASGVEGRLASACSSIIATSGLFNVYWLGTHEFEESSYFNLGD